MLSELPYRPAGCGCHFGVQRVRLQNRNDRRHDIQLRSDFLARPGR